MKYIVCDDKVYASLFEIGKSMLTDFLKSIYRLVWQDDEHNQSIPIFIFEDHPSLLHTETSGQLHVMASVMSSEFQMPPAPATQQQQLQQQQQQQMANVTQQQDVFDPITFFVSVGIAYLGFLGDQEVSPAILLPAGLHMLLVARSA